MANVRIRIILPFVNEEKGKSSQFSLHTQWKNTAVYYILYACRYQPIITSTTHNHYVHQVCIVFILLVLRGLPTYFDYHHRVSVERLSLLPARLLLELAWPSTINSGRVRAFKAAATALAEASAPMPAARAGLLAAGEAE